MPTRPSIIVAFTLYDAEVFIKQSANQEASR